MKKNKKLELKKETITILDKLQEEKDVGGTRTTIEPTRGNPSLCVSGCQPPSACNNCDSAIICMYE